MLKKFHNIILIILLRKLHTHYISGFNDALIKGLIY